MTEEPKDGPAILTVVIRNDAPLLHAGDCPSYRSVRVVLTEEQRKQLRLFYVARSSGTPMFEAVSRCFLEDESEEEKEA